MAKPATASNGFDAETVNRMLGKIDGFDADLDSERGSYMKKCRNIREHITAVYEEAKGLGIPQKELRTLIKIRKGEASNARLYAELENDQQHVLKMLAATEKVADLPLWRAAIKPIPGVDVAKSGQTSNPMFDA